MSLTAPKHYPLFLLNRFLRSKREWVKDMVTRFPPRLSSTSRQSREEYLEKKEEARAVLLSRAAFFAHLYNTSFKKLSIRNQSSRWGSCSTAKNLSFNYRVAFLPPSLRDYVVAHEVCHLREMNHSKKFWDLLREVFPNYRELKQELQGIATSR